MFCINLVKISFSSLDAKDIGPTDIFSKLLFLGFGGPKKDISTKN